MDFTDDDNNSESLTSDAYPATGSVVAAASACPADTTWCGTLTVGTDESVSALTTFQYFGYDPGDVPAQGSLSPATFSHGGTAYTVVLLERRTYFRNSDGLFFTDELALIVEGGGDLPDGTTLTVDGRTSALTVGTDSHSSTLGKEEWNLLTLGSPPDWVDGQEVTVSLNLPPALVSAKVDGAALVLTYSEDLDTGSEPATNAYTVTVAGSAATVSNVAVSGAAVTLTLANAVSIRQTVTVSYTAPTNNPVQDESGLDAPSFSNRAVTNNTGSIPAVGAPTISGVAQEGETLTADTSGITDANGLTGVSYRYQWLRFKAQTGEETIIPGATSSTYTLVQGDVGLGIKVRVSFTDDDGFMETLTSDDHPLSAPFTDNGHPAPVVMGAQTSCPAGDDWCATLTVGVNPLPSVPSSIRAMGMQGYAYDEVQNQAQGPTLGAMGDYRPTLGGDTYTINTLLVSLGTWPDWNLGIYTEPVLPLGTRLTLNGLTFTMTRGAKDGSDGYKWEPPPYRPGQLAWVENQKVTVSLRARENHAATGRPAIAGRLEVGSRLRAVTDGIADANGLDNVNWRYQWVRVSSGGIDFNTGATGEFFTPGFRDEGYRLKVRVSFTDDHGFREVRESERTAAIRDVLADADTLLNTELRVAGSSSVKGCESVGNGLCSDRLGRDSFTSTDLDGEALRLRIKTLRLHNVPAEHGGETNLFVYFDRKLREYERENLTLVLDTREFPFSRASDRTTIENGVFWYDVARMTWSEDQDVRLRIKDTYKDTSANRRPTGRPSISGGTRVGDTVSAEVGTLADPDGLPEIGTFSWQWVRVNDGAETDIAGATSETYTLTAEDRGRTVKVKASYTDNHGNVEGPLTSGAFPRAGGRVQAAPSGVEFDTTFTVRQVARSLSRIPTRVGCSDEYGNSRCLGNMGRTRFQYRGREYQITTLYVDDGRLQMHLEWPGETGRGVTTFPADNGMWLEVDGNRQFDAAESTSAFHSSWTQSRYWNSTGLNWSVGQRVRVRICDGRCQRVVTADDAAAVEGVDASLDFAVSMYPPSGSAVTVAYATSDVTATAGEDYRQTSGTLTFAPGETQKTISVPIIDDAVEDSGEQVRLSLDNLSDGVLGGGGEAIGTIRNEEAAALTASFSELPEAHDGSEDFTVQLDFSEAPEAGIGRLEGSLEVTGGTLVQARRVTKGDDAKWTVTLRPSGNDAVEVSLPLPETTDCEDDAAICTPDGRMLSEAAAATVPGPAAAQADGAQPLTASFSALPEAHDGETAFTLRVAFSEALPRGSKPLLRRALSVTGGSKSTILRVDDRLDLWEVTVTPSGTGEVTVTLAAAGSCGDAAALCTSDGRMLSEAVTAAVPGPATEAEAPPPLTASFQNVPSEHDGETAFTLRVAFSEALPQGSKPQLRRALSVTGGSKSTILRVDGRLDLWEVTVTPSGTGEVTVTLASAGSCGDAAALCTSDGRALTGGPVTVTVQGPPGLAVADAEVDEAAEDAALAFVVTLDRAASGAVTVAYETSDGTAVAPADYTSTSGTLTFAVGETTKTVSVPVQNDALDEGNETMTLTLSDPTGAYLADAAATGTIHNTGPIPRAWLARFGRTVADQVIDAVDGRLRAARTPGIEATVAGQALSFDAAAVDAGILAAREEEARTQAFTAWLRGEGGVAERAALSGARAVTARELLTRTSVAVTGGSAAGGTVSAWGRGTVARFDGREGELTLDGEVGNLMLGADFTHGRATAGLAVSHARGSGGYRGESAGRIEAILTGLYPYGRYAVNERLSGWGIAGYGKGTLRVEPEAQAALETDMDLAMASVGVRGILVKAPPEGGAELAVKSDAMVVRTTSEAVSGSGGNLAAAEAEVTRLRLGLEGARAFRFAGGASLTPSVELGVRHDGGDAESGFGADIGAALAWQDPAMGLSADVSARGLLTHEDGSFREWGFAGVLAWDPAPASARGPSLSVRQTVGAPAAGGLAALLGPQTAQALGAANAPGSGSGAGGNELERRRLEAKAGYGLPLFDGRWTGTPELGLGLTESGHELVLAWRLAEEKSAGLAFGLDVEGARQENAGGTAGHRLGLGFGWRLEGAGADGFEVRFEGTRLQLANDAAEHRAGLTFAARW